MSVHVELLGYVPQSLGKDGQPQSRPDPPVEEGTGEQEEIGQGQVEGGVARSRLA